MASSSNTTFTAASLLSHLSAGQPVIRGVISIGNRRDVSIRLLCATRHDGILRIGGFTYMVFGNRFDSYNGPLWPDKQLLPMAQTLRFQTLTQWIAKLQELHPEFAGSTPMMWRYSDASSGRRPATRGSLPLFHLHAVHTLLPVFVQDHRWPNRGRENAIWRSLSRTLWQHIDQMLYAP